MALAANRVHLLRDGAIALDPFEGAPLKLPVFVVTKSWWGGEAQPPRRRLNQSMHHEIRKAEEHAGDQSHQEARDQKIQSILQPLISSTDQRLGPDRSAQQPGGPENAPILTVKFSGQVHAP